MQKTAVLIDKPKNNKIVRGIEIPEHLQHLSRENLRYRKNTRRVLQKRRKTD